MPVIIHCVLMNALIEDGLWVNQKVISFHLR